MSSKKNKMQWVGAMAVLVITSATLSCTGFFMNPIISSLSIGPASPTIQTGTTNNTVQMTASGTNSDGSIASHPSVAWTINPTSVATITSSGLVTSAGVGTASVTATSNQNTTITATQSVTVTVGCIQSILVTPTSPQPISGTNPSDTLVAMATTCNGVDDVTPVATWKSSDTTLATVTQGIVSQVAGITTSGNVVITASVGSIVSNSVTISVGP